MNINEIRLKTFMGDDINWISKDVFHNLYMKSELEGTYVFVTSDCTNCGMYITECKKNKIDLSSFIFVDCLEDIDYFMDLHGLDDMPTTRLYSKNKIEWQKAGVLFSTQLTEMKEKWNNINNSS